MNCFTIEEINNAVQSTGFIFEQNIASLIENVGFDVITNYAYLDADEGKSREIDIVAHKQMFELKDRNIRGVCYLICECKDSDNPLVFFVRKKTWGDKYYRPQEIQLLHHTYFDNSKGETKTFDGFYFMQLEDHFSYTKAETKATQFCKVVRNGSKIEAQTSGLIDSMIFPMAKAYLYNSGNAPRSNEAIRYCKFFYNLIVTNSELYTMNADMKNDSVKRTDFVPFVRSIHSETLNGTFLTFFVNSGYLKDFIEKEVNTFCEAVFKKYSENIRFQLGPALQDLG
jgi:hypothetical protein